MSNWEYSWGNEYLEPDWTQGWWNWSDAYAGPDWTKEWNNLYSPSNWSDAYAGPDWTKEWNNINWPASTGQELEASRRPWYTNPYFTGNVAPGSLTEYYYGDSGNFLSNLIGNLGKFLGQYLTSQNIASALSGYLGMKGQQQKATAGTKSTVTHARNWGPLNWAIGQLQDLYGANLSQALQARDKAGQLTSLVDFRPYAPLETYQQIYPLLDEYEKESMKRLMESLPRNYGQWAALYGTGQHGPGISSIVQDIADQRDKLLQAKIAARQGETALQKELPAYQQAALSTQMYPYTIGREYNKDLGDLLARVAAIGAAIPADTTTTIDGSARPDALERSIRNEMLSKIIGSIFV